MSRPLDSRQVISAYVWSGVLFTLAASLIWATNTIFVMQVGGLTIFEAMFINSIFLVAQAVCEIPTGVVADTIGRKSSFLIGIATILVSTVLYVLTPMMHWGLWGFIVASVLIGVGFTFQTGAVDAWLVDALDATGYELPKDRVFALGQMTSGAGMLVGSILGGLLGQINLAIPYLVRAGLLVGTFLVVLLRFQDVGFESRPLKASTFAAETRTIFAAGVRFGWRDAVIRPLLFVSLVGGIFFMFGFYSWQPFVLQLLGKNAVWLLGFVQAAFSLAGIAGSSLVKRIMRTGELRRDPARVLMVTSIAQTMLVLAIGVIGVMTHAPGVVPASAAIALWLAWGVVFGISGPVRQSYINAHIASAQRATVLSLDAFFGDVGGGAGQPALGWLAGRASFGLSWLVGAAFLALTAPLYAWAGRADKTRAEGTPE